MAGGVIGGNWIGSSCWLKQNSTIVASNVHNGAVLGESTARPDPLWLGAGVGVECCCKFIQKSTMVDIGLDVAGDIIENRIVSSINGCCY